MHVTQLYGSSEPSSQSRRASQIRWARRPLITPIGRAVAVSLFRGVVSIAVETDRGVAWISADQVDDVARLEDWAATSF